jgi:hypothetical protein
MVHSLHKYVSAFVRRRQQATEFSVKYKEYLKEDISAFEAYSTIQLVLVSFQVYAYQHLVF